ncbi:MAG: hypothetical protein LBN18_01330, partial [Dysgonamonadaceae bacterium]|nr:hypothetical protein [Dysgonamonadaceae bacterium]
MTFDRQIESCLEQIQTLENMLQAINDQLITLKQDVRQLQNLHDAEKRPERVSVFGTTLPDL